jgi:hypothetical protein
MNPVQTTGPSGQVWEMNEGIQMAAEFWLVVGIAGGIGLMLGALLAAMYFRPELLAMVAKLKSILFIAGGIGLLVWGILSLSLGETFAPPFETVSLFRSPIECLAWGSGLLTAGILYLVYGFVGFSSRS